MWFFVNQDSSFTLDDSDYSIIGRDQPSTIEYLKKSNKNIDGWIESSELSQLDDKRRSIISDYATVKEHEMLNYILGIDYETQHAALDSENYDQENIFGNHNMLNSNKSADYVYTYGEEDASHDPHNNCDELLQKDVPPLLTHDNNADENLNVHAQCNATVNLALTSSSSAPTLSGISCPIATLGTQDATITSQNSVNNITNGTVEEVMEAPTHAMHKAPSTDHGGYFHYSNAVNKVSLPAAAIEGDYVDYSANGEHSENLPIGSQPMCPVPLENFEDGRWYNSTHDTNAIPQFQINPEKIVTPASNEDYFDVKEGLYISIDSGTTVYQSTDQNMHLDEDQVYCAEELVTNK